MRSVSMPVSKPLNPRGWPINIGGGLVASEIAQSCPTLCDPMDCSLPVSSVYEIFQARILESVAISFSRGSSQHGNRTGVSTLQADSLPTEQ